VATDKSYSMQEIPNPEYYGNVDKKMIDEYKLPIVDMSFFIEFYEKLLELTDLRLPENGALEF
jgi:hypothetical protein